MTIRSPAFLDVAAIAVCALIWGTTWFAITLQFGVVDPVVSCAYRFALAGAVLFAWSAARRDKLALTRKQHVAALGMGFFTFGVNYALVYWAEERVVSAVVAVIFAAMAFVNLIAFRLTFGERAPSAAWTAAAMGIGGVVVLSWSELVQTSLSQRTLTGIGLTFVGVLGASVGNLFARSGDKTGVSLISATAWAMAYGAVLLALFALVTGRAFLFDPSAKYVLSLLYLSLLGSVVAFLVYFWLARRRGYSTASYISALTTPTAMLISSVMEKKHWSVFALAGVALVLAGQWLLLRARRGGS
jgi:drug/metabolite transporter (DMT)-like permease